MGIYIRNGLNFEIMQDLSPFENKVIEALTVKVIYPNKKNLLCTSIYRSNGPIPGVTAAVKMERFVQKFDELLHNISQINLASLILMDSNIDLLNFDAEDSLNFLDCIVSKGYLQCIFKATRFENGSRTLIDNILSNRPGPVTTGTIISDISDHFFTFFQSPQVSPKKIEKTSFIKTWINDENLRKKRKFNI